MCKLSHNWYSENTFYGVFIQCTQFLLCFSIGYYTFLALVKGQVGPDSFSLMAVSTDSVFTSQSPTPRNEIFSHEGNCVPLLLHSFGGGITGCQGVDEWMIFKHLLLMELSANDSLDVFSLL